MGVSLLLAVLLTQAAAETADQPAAPEPLVEEVELRLQAGGNPKLLEDAPGLVLVRRGQRLSVRGVRRSIERLMATGHFADVEVYAEEIPEGLRVIFEIKAKQTIGAVYVEGNLAFTDAELLAPSKLSPESEFYPQRASQARDAMLQLYRRKGYRDARVDVRETEGEAGVDVGFFVIEGLPMRLSGVVVAGDPGISMPRLMHELELELVQVLDLSAVEAGLERLKQTLRAEHFYRARVDPPQIENGVLVLPIIAGPKIEFSFVGNTAFAPSALLRVVGWDGSEFLDQTVTDRLAAQLTSFYRYRGFHDVRVTVRERPGATPRSAVIVFTIDEGPQLVVRSVTFIGNESIASKELGDVLAEVVRSGTPATGTEVHPIDDPVGLEGKIKTARFGEPPAPAPETVLVEAAYLEAARAMARLYRSRGFAKASVQVEEIDLTRDGAAVRFAVVEGPQTLVRRVQFIGASPGFPEPSSVAMSAGDPLSDRRLDQWKQTLARDLARRGFLYGSVEAEIQVEEDGTQADLTFRVLTGPQVTVGKVWVRGNERTHESIVRDQVDLKEGEPLDPDRLYVSQRNLLGLSIFRAADVRILAPESHDTVKDIVVEVRERGRLSGELGIGYFLAEGVRVTVDGDVPNLFGRAINLQARFKGFAFSTSGLAITDQVDVSDLKFWEAFGGSANVSVSNRGLLPFGIGARVDLVGERLFRQSYRFNRVAIVPGLDWSKAFNLRPLPSWWWLDLTRPKVTLQLQYELERAAVSQVNRPGGVIFPLLRADQERLRFLFGEFALHTVRFAPTIDLRDDPAVPKKGLLIQGAVETTFPLETRDQQQLPVVVQFLKLSGTVSVYFPLYPRVVLALSGRSGTIIPLATGSVTPPVKRFFLGGSSSLRGFREDGLIAEDQRQGYRQQVDECRVLAANLGCTPAAITLLGGKEVASQGGEVFALGKAELRVPFVGALDLGVFFEAGNLWLARPTYFSLRPVFGTGLRYVTPIGPLALDVGFNLAPDQLVNEPTFNIHFNIGLF
jgi:outer membrane protein insertion porin family